MLLNRFLMETQTLIEDNSDALIFGAYEYSYGVLDLNDGGMAVPFELNVGGVANRVEFQTIGEL